MHEQVLQWVAPWATSRQSAVLDIGGRDLNGTCRSLFPNADYTTLDIEPGDTVDIVADATTWQPDRAYDVVVCTEVLEHTPDWRHICATAHKALRPAGRFVVTCAGPGRPPHSGRSAVPHLAPGEWYENVSPADLSSTFADVGFEVIACRQHGLDTQAVAIKPAVLDLPDEMTPEPFPHVVADGMWPAGLLDEIITESPDLNAGWKRYGTSNEVKLEGGQHLWGPATITYFALLALPDNLRRIEKLTGIPDLSMETIGGGYHLIPPGGGKLGIHTDFNRSPNTGLYRRLNCLTYLNHRWDDDGGRLELWPDGDGDPLVVAPEWNRTVIFETSDRSWHGHPRPADRWRLSVAAYFFSEQPPPGHSGDHSTVWR